MNKLRNEIKKIRAMNRKEAADYITMYYIPVLVGTLLVFFLLISTVSQTVKNRQLKPVVRAGIVADLDMYCRSHLDNMLRIAFPDADGKYAPIIRTFSSPSESTDMFSSIELSSYIAAGDVDFLIGDQNTSDLLAESGNLISTTDISSTTLGRLAESAGIKPLYYIYFTERTGAEKSACFLHFILNDKVPGRY